MTRVEPKKDEIYCADAREQLARFPDRCFDMVVTSPPYYRQRNYAEKDQIGQEEDARGVRRTSGRRIWRVASGSTRPGSLWLVLGDKYVSTAAVGIALASGPGPAR